MDALTVAYSIPVALVAISQIIQILASSKTRRAVEANTRAIDAHDQAINAQTRSLDAHTEALRLQSDRISLIASRRGV